jgi:methyl-galactoside transport system substrate-binding protein
MRYHDLYRAFWSSNNHFFQEEKVKKACFIFLIAALVLSFVACGGGGGSSSSGQPSIGVAIYKFDDTFMSYTRNAIEQNAQGKATLEVVDSQNAQATQNDQVDAFLSKKLKAIAINPVDRTAAATIIEKAQAAKTPVVFFNREPLPEDMGKWDKVYYVGAKAEESGSMQGEIAYDYWNANKADCDKNGDGVLQYIMLKGEPGTRMRN